MVTVKRGRGRPKKIVLNEKKEILEQSALKTEVGGNHYRNMVIQPVEFIMKNNLNFLQGCIIKRICRYKEKDGILDLQKIKHEVDLLIELER